MSVIVAKPTSPGRRFVIKTDRSALHKGGPYLALTKSKTKTGGRNNYGDITIRHRGGGCRKHYRIIDFKRNKDNIVAKVERLEYDPNRSAYIALLLYRDGERRYIIAPRGLNVGDEVLSGPDVPIKKGYCLPIRSIPVGTIICCVELRPGKGAQLVRSAGTFAQLLAKEGEYATLKLRSGEVRKVLIDCRACIGEVSNSEHNLCSFGKAGATRWRGRRPHVRGEAMNPVDHPHGGRTRGGRHPVSPWGMPTKGYKTRNNKRTDKFIISRRGKNKG